MPTSLVVFFLTGILFSVLAIPLIRRKVRMNSWYGIRIPKTMQSESVWFEVNAIMGRFLFTFGLLIAVVALYYIRFPLEEEYKMVYILLGILFIGAILFVKLSFSTANRIASKK